MWKKGIILAIVLISTGMMAFGTLFDVEEVNIEKDRCSVAAYKPIVVLELYTSQGCSSCPAADALLEKLKKEFDKNVFAITYHVDYWNYLGWQDPFSKPEYAQKQRDYNVKFRNSSNYTPQVVVNEKEHFVGSNASKMYEVIERYSNRKSSNQIVILKTKINKNSVQFDYRINGDLTNKKIRAVLVLDQRVTEVKRGENGNKTLTNSNIVIAEKTILIQESQDGAYISIPEIVDSQEKIQLLLILENEEYDITAAAKSEMRR